MSGVATLKLRGAKRHFDEMAVDLPLPPQTCSPGRFPLRPPPLKRGRCNSPPAPASSSPTSFRVAKPSAAYPSLPHALSLPIASHTHPNHHQLHHHQHQHQHHHHDSVAASVGASNPAASASGSASEQQQQHASVSSKQHTDAATSTQATTSAGGGAASSSPQAQAQAQACNVSAEELAALARHLPRRLKRVVDRLAVGDVTSAERLFSLTDLREIVTSVLAEHEAKLNDKFTLTLNDRLQEQFRDFTKFNEDYVSRQLRGTDVAYLS